MSEIIRLVKSADFVHLHNLYQKRKSISELKWLLQDPDDSAKFNGYVAVNKEDTIVGMIGFISSTYKFGDKEFIGVIPMSWKIEEGYKGMAGIQLFKKVLQHGDFNLTIEGSLLAQSIYPMFGLKNVGCSHTCMKLLKPLQYYLSFENKPLYRRLGNFAIMLQSFIKKTPKVKGVLDINEVNINDIDKNVPYLYKNYLEKKMSANYIKWLLKCPVNKSFGFEIYNKDKFIGYSVCYVHRIKGKYNRGRIVYIPNFESNNLLSEDLIAFLTRFLKKKGCASISMSLMDLNLLNVVKGSGFIDYTSKDKPIFVRPSNILETIGVNVDNWYMQYTEGDKAYRNI